MRSWALRAVTSGRTWATQKGGGGGKEGDGSRRALGGGQWTGRSGRHKRQVRVAGGVAGRAGGAAGPSLHEPRASAKKPGPTLLVGALSLAAALPRVGDAFAPGLLGPGFGCGGAFCQSRPSSPFFPFRYIIDLLDYCNPFYSFLYYCCPPPLQFTPTSPFFHLHKQIDVALFNSTPKTPVFVFFSKDTVISLNLLSR